jgi:hypothetical protein
MVAGHREHARLPDEDRSHDDVGLLQRDPACHQVDIVLTQRPEGVVPRRLDDLDLALRMKRLEHTDDLDEVRAARRPAEEAEPQRPLEAASGRVCALEHPVSWSYAGQTSARNRSPNRVSWTRRLVRCTSWAPSLCSSPRRL